MASDKAALTSLLDREAIRALPVRYCHLVLKKDIDAIMDLFCTDGSMELLGELGKEGERFFSGDALRAMMGNGLEDIQPWPFIHNHEVRLEGPDTATGLVHAEFRMGSQGYKLTFLGLYDDLYVKVGGAWKFKHRRLQSFPVAG